VELIQNRNLQNTDYGRVMNAAAAALLRTVYPDMAVRFFPPDSPQTHSYTKIIRNAERGIYTTPAPSARDFLEFVLPFLAYYSLGESRISDSSDSRLLNAISDLVRASQLNPHSVLPLLFQGFVYERNGDIERSEAAYGSALELASSCYPAELGLIRLLRRQGRGEEENARLSDLLERYPDNLAVKKQLARNYAAAREWPRAEAAAAEILQRSPRDGEFLLLSAFMAIEQGQFQRAQTPLDSHASIDASGRDYLF
jgi:tetratricopeptide (TPR) repeat protein